MRFSTQGLRGQYRKRCGKIHYRKGIIFMVVCAYLFVSCSGERNYEDGKRTSSGEVTKLEKIRRILKFITTLLSYKIICVIILAINLIYKLYSWYFECNTL